MSDKHPQAAEIIFTGLVLLGCIIATVLLMVKHA